MSESDYIAGDPEYPIRDIPRPLRSERSGHPYWRALSVPERIAVVRWLKRGHARNLLNALANNPSSCGLRAFVAEGLVGGPETGWRLRIASRAIGDAPTEADKAKLTALETALANHHDDVAKIATRLASVTIGERSRRGRSNDPMQSAMIGIDYAMAYDRLRSSKQALYEVARFYNTSEKNIEKLNTAFWKAKG